jgi:hypothetical protein
MPPDADHPTVHEQHRRDPALPAVDARLVLWLERRGGAAGGADHPGVEHREQLCRVGRFGRHHVVHVARQSRVR